MLKGFLNALIGHRYGGSNETAKRAIMQSSPAEDYRAVRFYRAETVIEELPIFTLPIAQLMLADTDVGLGLRIRDALLSMVEVEIESDDADVKEYVEQLWGQLWGNYSHRLLETKRWGFSAWAIDYGSDELGRLSVDDVQGFAYGDVRCETHRGHAVGFRLKHRDSAIYAPMGLWTTFDAKYHNFYGESILRRAYPAWYEKWMDFGAKKTLQLRMMKDATRGDGIYYPDEKIQYLDNGQTREISAHDVAREMQENMRNNSSWRFPSTEYPTGGRKYEYVPPWDGRDPVAIFTWLANQNEDILKALDVLPEVVKAAETGSGFSGRSVPLLITLQAVAVEFQELLHCIKSMVLMPCAQLCYHNARFEIKPKPLTETMSDDIGGSSMGGGSIGGGPREPGQLHEPVGRRRNPHYGRTSQFSETAHAPSGGVMLQGKFYEGGEFIPGEVIDSLSDKERSNLKGETRKPEKSDSDKAGRIRDKIKRMGIVPRKSWSSVETGVKDRRFTVGGMSFRALVNEDIPSKKLKGVVDFKTVDDEMIVIKEFSFYNEEVDDNSFGVTNTGHAKGVIESAIGLVAGWLESDTDALYFSAKEESRQRLYNSLVKRMAVAYPNYTAHSAKLPSGELAFFLSHNDYAMKGDYLTKGAVQMSEDDISAQQRAIWDSAWRMIDKQLEFSFDDKTAQFDEDQHGLSVQFDESSRGSRDSSNFIADEITDRASRKNRKAIRDAKQAIGNRFKKKRQNLTYDRLAP